MKNLSRGKIQKSEETGQKPERSNVPRKDPITRRMRRKLLPFTLMLPLLTPIFGGCESSKSDKPDIVFSEPPITVEPSSVSACSDMEPIVGMLEKDFRQGDSIKIGQGIDAGCKRLLLLVVGPDDCGDQGGPYVELRLLDKEGNTVPLKWDRTTEIDSAEVFVYREKDESEYGGSSVIFLHYPDAGASAVFPSPAYLKIKDKTYKLELIDTNPIQKTARLRITDINPSLELPNHVEERELVVCTSLDETELEGTPIVEGTLNESQSPWIPSSDEVLTLRYEGENESFYGRDIHFYVIKIEEHEERGAKVQLGAVMGSMVFEQQYTQECSWLDLPCTGIADYRIYIDKVDTSGPRENWSVRIRIHKLSG